MAITVMEVLKNLPRTNCGDCGQPTCLAFATQVIKEGEDLNKCPHLTGAGADMGKAVRAQQEAGVGRRRESLAISLEVLQEKVAPLAFAALAEGLGATYGEEAGRPYLSLTYFGHRLQVFKDELRYPPGAPADPWDAILLYNYIASQGHRAGGGPVDRLQQPAQLGVQGQDPGAAGTEAGGPLRRPDRPTQTAGRPAGGRAGGGGRGRRRPDGLLAAA